MPVKEKTFPTFHSGWPNEIAVILNCAVNHTSLGEMPAGSIPVDLRRVLRAYEWLELARQSFGPGG